jgi:hypothetical protein
MLVDYTNRQPTGGKLEAGRLLFLFRLIRVCRIPDLRVRIFSPFLPHIANDHIFAFCGHLARFSIYSLFDMTQFTDCQRQLILCTIYAVNHSIGFHPSLDLYFSLPNLACRGFVGYILSYQSATDNFSNDNLRSLSLQKGKRLWHFRMVATSVAWVRRAIKTSLELCQVLENVLKNGFSEALLQYAVVPFRLIIHLNPAGIIIVWSTSTCGSPSREIEHNQYRWKWLVIWPSLHCLDSLLEPIAPKTKMGYSIVLDWSLSEPFAST